jgi:hypothetical protein
VDNIALRSLPFFSHFVLQTGNWCPNTRLDCQFPVRNTKWLKNGKLHKAILFQFYNISQRNFVILLILWCSFKLWWNFCLNQNLVYNANGPLKRLLSCYHNLKQMTHRNIDNFIYFPYFYNETYETADNNYDIGFIVPNIQQYNHGLEDVEKHRANR